MNMIEYKGYLGIVTYDDEAGTFFGRVNNLPRNAITFEGSSVEDLRTAFRESVDTYLKCCKDRGETPDKSYSGKFNIRIPSALHAKAVVKARARGVSRNDFVMKAIENELGTETLALARKSWTGAGLEPAASM
jgi:predicted HicB family RNase H-like nuclease